MLYIVGLGNPGEKYKNTRHNVAWLVLDELFQDNWSHHKYMNAEIRTGHHGLFIKPQTFMNKSGEVISFLKKEIDFDPEHIVVMYDDIDLPFGQIRISHDRGDGGHNGMKSITQHLGSRKSIRIRIGISRLLDDGRIVKPNVLGNFEPNQLEVIQSELVERVQKIIASLDRDGLQKTMNQFNTK